MTTTVAGNDDMDKVLTSYFDKTANSNTIKEKPVQSSELSKGDLLKILSYLEGEVQARDVVIATLKCERVKRLLADNKYSLSSNPSAFAALKRDGFSTTFVNSSESKEEIELMRLWENQKISLENLIQKQKHAMKHLGNILSDSDNMHGNMVNELEDEKAKNASLKDGAKIRDELELERQLRVRLEKELKESRDAHEEEKTRHKSIVLLLLNERKRILRQFVEERKRSAGIASMLEEEKKHSMVLAEGLEEETQKSLKMESDLEKQIRETRLLNSSEEKRLELESHIKMLRTEAESLRKQLSEYHSSTLSSHPHPVVHGPTYQTTATTSLNNSSTNTVLKKSHTPNTGIRPPSATITSVPVSQPATGIGKSISSITQSPTTHNNSSSPVANSLLQGRLSGSGGIDRTSSSSATGTIIQAPKKYSLGRPVVPPNPPVPNKPQMPNKPLPPPKSGNLTKLHAAKIEQQIT